MSILEKLDLLDQVNIELVTGEEKPACKIIQVSIPFSQFEQTLLDLGLRFDQTDYERIDVGSSVIERADYAIAKHDSAFERLLSSKTAFEEGLALGYPLDSCDAYMRVIDGKPRNGEYLQHQYARAMRAGVPVPLWFAYLSHVPAEMDICSGSISKSSIEQGKKYQEYIRENRPLLGRMLEEKFERKQVFDPYDKIIWYAA